MKKILIDSDICLDSITARYPHSIHANRLFSLVEKGTVKAVVSGGSFSNIYYILRRLSNSERALEQLQNLRQLMDVSTLKTSTIDLALASGWRDFEDALQYYCAVENECEAIITRNRNDFEQADIPVKNALEYVNELEERL